MELHDPSPQLTPVVKLIYLRRLRDDRIDLGGRNIEQGLRETADHNLHVLRGEGKLLGAIEGHGGVGGEAVPEDRQKLAGRYIRLREKVGSVGDAGHGRGRRFEAHMQDACALEKDAREVWCHPGPARKACRRRAVRRATRRPEPYALPPRRDFRKRTIVQETRAGITRKASSAAMKMATIPEFNPPFLETGPTGPPSVARGRQRCSSAVAPAAGSLITSQCEP